MRKSFTLVELLVVIAVIALLASMMLPALAKARERAKSIQCMGNLKQTGVTLNMYSQDFGGYLPKYYDTVAFIGWTTLMMNNGYIKPFASNEASFLTCPTFFPPVYSKWWRTYGIRAKGVAANDYVNIYRTPIVFKAAGSYSQPWTASLAPSQASILADTANMDDTPVAQSYWFSADQTRVGPHARHSQKANMYFADGHVDGVEGTKMGELFVKYYFSAELLLRDAGITR